MQRDSKAPVFPLQNVYHTKETHWKIRPTQSYNIHLGESSSSTNFPIPQRRRMREFDEATNNNFGVLSHRGNCHKSLTCSLHSEISFMAGLVRRCPSLCHLFQCPHRATALPPKHLHDRPAHLQKNLRIRRLGWCLRLVNLHRDHKSGWKRVNQPTLVMIGYLLVADW